MTQHGKSYGLSSLISKMSDLLQMSVADDIELMDVDLYKSSSV